MHPEGPLHFILVLFDFGFWVLYLLFKRFLHCILYTWIVYLEFLICYLVKYPRAVLGLFGCYSDLLDQSD